MTSLPATKMGKKYLEGHTSWLHLKLQDFVASVNTTLLTFATESQNT